MNTPMLFMIAAGFSPLILMGTIEKNPGTLWLFRILF